MTFEKHSHKERLRLLTITQLLNASAMVLGSWMGYLLLGPGVPKASDYAQLFALSSCLRLVPFLVLPKLGDSRLRGILLRTRLFPR
jgi:hypothetical protein